MKGLTALCQITALLLALMAANLQTPTGTTRNTPIGVGEMAPDFTLSDQRGEKVTLSESRGKNPAILVFYRGYW